MQNKSTNFFPGTHQVLSYNSETGAKRFKKSEAPMSHFSREIDARENLGKKPIHLHHHNKLSVYVTITTFGYIIFGAIKRSGP